MRVLGLLVIIVVHLGLLVVVADVRGITLQRFERQSRVCHYVTRPVRRHLSCFVGGLHSIGASTAR